MHGRTIYRLAAPGWLKLPLPPTARRVRGLFGQFEMGGDDLAIKQSGVTFVILHLDEAGRSTSLFQKTLNPWSNPADRGEQKFDLLLPGLRGGSLRLETHAGQSWAEGCYWGDVRWE